MYIDPNWYNIVASSKRTFFGFRFKEVINIILIDFLQEFANFKYTYFEYFLDLSIKKYIDKIDSLVKLWRK